MRAEREASKVSKLPESLTFLAEQIRSYLDSTLADLLYVKSLSSLTVFESFVRKLDIIFD